MRPQLDSASRTLHLLLLLRVPAVLRPALVGATVLALLLAIVAAPAALAQSEEGSIYGTVADADGEPLPGASVTLTGVGAPELFVTGADGAFRFLGLAPGNYAFTVRLDGFSSAEYTDLEIQAGRNYTFQVGLAGAVEDVITVTSRAPVLDERKISQTVSLSERELEKLPTARDPWAFVTQAPGVVTDRVNVGGNESGQQANFVGTGALSDQNVFRIDGIDVTDQTALGGSSTYFGFEQFEQLDVSTGGTDVTQAAPGVQVNLVTKRGTNRWRGSGRYFFTDDSLQSSSGLSRGDLAAGQRDADPASLTPNQVQEIGDYGAEAGGPAWRDKVFVWAAYDKMDITQSVFGGLPDNTILENYTAKVNGQVTPSTDFVASYNRGDKIKSGRGAGPDRPPETTWDQSGPTDLWKAQVNHVFSNSFLASLTYGFIDGGFVLDPKGGADAQGVTLGADGIFRNSYFFLDTNRDSQELSADGNYFFNAAGGGHELKFGAQFREHENFSNYGFPNQLAIAGEVVGLPEGLEFVQLWRQQFAKNTNEYTSAWLQDTHTRDRLTVNLGVRYDLQESTNEAVVQPGNDLSPNLGEIDYPGADGGFQWETLSPRIGATYALGEDRSTLLRASYSRFASQLGSSIPLLANPTLYAYGNYTFVDDDGDLLVDPAEVPSLTFLSPVNFDPAAPNSIVSPNRIDPDLSPETTDEVILGIEREVVPSLVLGGRVTWRNTSDVIEARTLVRDAGLIRLATVDDYLLDVGGLDPSVDSDGDGLIDGTLPDGSAYAVPVYRLRDGLERTGGSLFTSGDRETDYLGVSVSAEKRLTGRWSGRAYANWYDWEWTLGPEFRRFNDPTDEDNASGDPLELADDDGGIVAEQSGGSGNVTPFLNSRWSVGLSSIVRLPWDLNLSSNVTAREGFPQPYFRSVTTSDGGSIDVQLVDEVGQFRTDDLYVIDLGIDKELQFNDVAVRLRLDGFNLLNEGTVLQRERDAGTGRVDFVDQILGPRVFRFGVKLSLR